MSDRTTEAAEECTLSAILLDMTVLGAVREIVRPESFESLARRRIYTAMCAVVDRGATLDPLTLVHELETRKTLDAVGGRDYVTYLVDVVPTAANVQYHAKIVREKAQRRAFLSTLEAATELIRNGELPTHELASQLQQDLLPLATNAEAGGYREVTKRELEQLAEVIDDRAKAIAEGRVAGLPTGYDEIDDVTNGFRAKNGEFIIFAAVPKAWKSALVDNIVLNLLRKGHVGGKVAAEMTRDETLERMMAAEAGIESRVLAQGNLTEAEWKRYFQSAPLLASGFHIDDQAWPALDTVLARACDLKNRVPELEYLVIDYLQLITNRMQGRRGDEEINAVCKAFKGLGKKLGCVVFAPAQCNFKEIEAREEKRPTLRDIQGASGPVQDANFVGLLYNDRMYNPMAPAELEINFAASRRTPTWIARLAMRPSYQRLDNRR